MLKLGFIGMGNMGYAILKGIKKNMGESEIVFSAINIQKAEKIARENNIKFIPDNKKVAKESKIIILAIKPQIFDEVFSEIRDCLQNRHIVISLAPGFSLEQLKEKAGKRARIVRAMPNTPALVGEGMSGLVYKQEEFSKKEEEDIKRLFISFGKVLKIKEDHMNALVALSGSSPAYMYMLIDAMADWGVRHGIKKTDAIMLAAQSMLGSAKLLLEEKESPASLKDRVCSPGGSTIAAVLELEKEGFRSAIASGCEACYRRCREMEKPKTEEE